MGMPQKTPGEYQVWECMSAMQKSIRRGLEEEAMYWALELEGTGLLAHALNRLKITAHEDIGLADPQAVMFAVAACEQCKAWHKTKNEAWHLALGNAIRVLARAAKSREADHFHAAIRWRRSQGWHPDIPDWALDKHTRRGRKMGRGLEHFRQEGAKLDKPVAESDSYIDDAYRFWEAQNKRSRATEPETQATLWERNSDSEN